MEDIICVHVNSFNVLNCQWCVYARVFPSELFIHLQKYEFTNWYSFIYCCQSLYIMSIVTLSHVTIPFDHMTIPFDHVTIPFDHVTIRFDHVTVSMQNFYLVDTSLILFVLLLLSRRLTWCVFQEIQKRLKCLGWSSRYLFMAVCINGLVGFAIWKLIQQTSIFNILFLFYP